MPFSLIARKRSLDDAPLDTSIVGRAPISVTTIRPVDLTDEHVRQWNEILVRRPDLDSPFLSPEYVQAVGGARNDARVSILSRAGQTIGFFPYHLAARRIAKPIGGPMTDYQTVILDAGIDMTADGLLAACALNAYDYNHGLASLDWMGARALDFTFSPRVEFRDGVDAYVASLNSRQRQKIKEVDRRMASLAEEKGEIEFLYDDRDPAAWTWLVETKTSALAEQGLQAGFDTPWVKAVLASLTATKTPSFGTHLSTMRIHGRIIAAHFGMQKGATMCWWHTTYDRDFRKYGPGVGLIIRCMREGERSGLKVIDFGRGIQAYKQKFANAETALCEGSIWRTGTCAGALRSGQAAALAVASRIPLGKYADLPRRGSTRLISSVRLPRRNA
jgi:CelD/BcsL family acetyltransferase involved in cellulose biosynthesis